MSTNTLVDKVGTDIVTAAFWNDIHQALTGTFVGRVGGVAAPNQNLGSAVYPWGNAYIQNLIVNGQLINFAGLTGATFAITSGRTRTTSNQAQFIQASGSGVGFSILGSVTPLLVIIAGQAINVAVDLTQNAVLSGSGTNYNATLNNAAYNGSVSTKYIGEFDGTSIDITGAGSEIVGLIGTVQAFKNATTGEIFFAYIESNVKLSKVVRGWGYDSTFSYTGRQPLTNGQTIALLKASYVFLEDNAVTVSITNNAPFFGAEAPAGAVTNDYWYNVHAQEWNRYNGATWDIVLRHFLGIVVCNHIDCIAAESNNFDANFSSESNLELEYFSPSVVRSKNPDAKINVYGTELYFKNQTCYWDITTDLDTGLIEAPSTDYFFFVKDTGELVISDVRPREKLELKGYYHPYNPWRAVGLVPNDASSDFSANNLLIKNYTHIEHESLLNMQGGVYNEHYHLTSAEYVGTGTGVFARRDSPIFTTIINTPLINIGGGTFDSTSFGVRQTVFASSFAGIELASNRTAGPDLKTGSFVFTALWNSTGNKNIAEIYVKFGTLNVDYYSGYIGIALTNPTLTGLNEVITIVSSTSTSIALNFKLNSAYIYGNNSLLTVSSGSGADNTSLVLNKTVGFNLSTGVLVGAFGAITSHDTLTLKSTTGDFYVKLAAVNAFYCDKTTYDTVFSYKVYVNSGLIVGLTSLDRGGYGSVYQTIYASSAGPILEIACGRSTYGTIGGLNFTDYTNVNVGSRQIAAVKAVTQYGAFGSHYGYLGFYVMGSALLDNTLNWMMQHDSPDISNLICVRQVAQIRMANDAGRLYISGASSSGNGAYLDLRGNSEVGGPGNFYLNTQNLATANGFIGAVNQLSLSAVNSTIRLSTNNLLLLELLTNRSARFYGKIGIGLDPVYTFDLTSASTTWSTRVFNSSNLGAGSTLYFSDNSQVLLVGMTGSASNLGYGANKGVIGTITNNELVFYTNNILAFKVNTDQTLSLQTNITSNGGNFFSLNGGFYARATSVPSASVVGAMMNSNSGQGYLVTSTSSTGNIEHHYLYSPIGLIGSINTNGSFMTMQGTYIDLKSANVNINAGVNAANTLTIGANYSSGGSYGSPNVANAASAGDKIILYNVVSGAAGDFRIGVGDVGNLWVKTSDRFDVYQGSVHKFMLRCSDGIGYSVGGWTTFSDARIKKNISAFSGGLDIVSKLKPVHYNWNRINASSKPTNLGFVAQEVDEVLKLYTGQTEKTEAGEEIKDILAVKYGADFFAVLVSAVQELKAELDATKQELNTLKGA